LDPSISEREDDESDPKIELPLWMIKVFLINKSIQFDIPKAYNEIYRYTPCTQYIYIYVNYYIFIIRGVLMADANVVDLFKLCRHFYLFGKFLSQLDHREAYEIRKILIQVIKINYFCLYYNVLIFF